MGKTKKIVLPVVHKTRQPKAYRRLLGPNDGMTRREMRTADDVADIPRIAGLYATVGESVSVDTFGLLLGDILGR